MAVGRAGVQHRVQRATIKRHRQNDAAAVDNAHGYHRDGAVGPIDHFSRAMILRKQVEPVSAKVKVDVVVTEDVRGHHTGNGGIFRQG